MTILQIKRHMYTKEDFPLNSIHTYRLLARFTKMTQKNGPLNGAIKDVKCEQAFNFFHISAFLSTAP